MNIGLDFVIPNEHNNFLLKIFEGINFDEYDCEIVTNDTMKSKNWSDSIFPTDLISGKTFFECISIKKYYLIFVDVKVYPYNAERSRIESYDEFMNSKCELVFLCVDSQFITVFCKKENILEQIKANCEKNGFCDIREINDSEAKGHYFIAF